MIVKPDELDPRNLKPGVWVTILDNTDFGMCELVGINNNDTGQIIRTHKDNSFLVDIISAKTGTHHAYYFPENQLEFLHN